MIRFSAAALFRKTSSRNASYLRSVARTRSKMVGNTTRLPPPPRNDKGAKMNGIPMYIWFAAGGTVTVVGVCYYSFLDEVPITHRKRWIATSPEWERQLGDQEYQQLLQQFRRDILPPTHPACITLNRVGSRIADAALNFAKRHDIDYNDKPYTFTVVRTEMANAFVLPGNHVFVMTGLFRFVKDEDELAIILGHETGHNIARHAGEKVSSSVVVTILARLSLLFDPSGLVATLLLPAASLFRELPNSRTQEMEADAIGLKLAADACYDPRAAKRVFAAMKQDDNNDTATAAPPEFLSTHPSHDSRLSNFDVLIPQVMKGEDTSTTTTDMFRPQGGGYGGERCREVRQKMAAARKQAAFRQQQQRQQQQQ